MIGVLIGLTPQAMVETKMENCMGMQTIDVMSRNEGKQVRIQQGHFVWRKLNI